MSTARRHFGSITPDRILVRRPRHNYENAVRVLSAQELCVCECAPGKLENMYQIASTGEFARSRNASSPSLSRLVQRWHSSVRYAYVSRLSEFLR